MKIIIDRKPYASPRPRFKRMGKYVSTYMPPAYETEKEIIKKQIIEMLSNDFEMLEGAIEIEIIFYMEIPKSLSLKNKQKLNGKYHVKRPDLDNLIKTYFDVMTGLIYKDDSQISSYGNVKKRYSEYPRIEIKVNELEE